MSKWIERIGCFAGGSYFGYILLAIFTDLRIEGLRHYVAKTSIEIGIEAGIKAYKQEQKYNETELQRKRIKRDAALKRYVNKLDKILEIEPSN